MSTRCGQPALACRRRAPTVALDDCFQYWSQFSERYQSLTPAERCEQSCKPDPSQAEEDQYGTEDLQTTESRPFMGCGWFTPDYIHWIEPPIADLNRLGHMHDFKQVEPYGGWSWDRNTLRKAHELGRAMDRNPGRWVIFVDVDCRILKPLDERVNSFRDVGCYVQSRSSLK